MRQVTWEDKKGFKRRALVRDTDPDSAAKKGIDTGVPDLARLDWGGITLELHNLLHDRGLFSFRDVEANPGALTGAILSAMRARLIRLYRAHDKPPLQEDGAGVEEV